VRELVRTRPHVRQAINCGHGAATKLPHGCQRSHGTDGIVAGCQ
jgi:hypothetical protein